jgi:hypothetical protein
VIKEGVRPNSLIDADAQVRPCAARTRHLCAGSSRTLCRTRNALSS